jgi:hypothetical protein
VRPRKILPPVRRLPLVALLVLACTATACGNTGGRPGANTAAPSPSLAAARPEPPPLPFSYRLTTRPDRHETTYSHVLITLRETPPFRMSYSVDPAHPGAAAPLVAVNKATGEQEHWKMRPITVDGDAGYQAEYPVNGDTYLFCFFAKGPVSVTLKASLGRNDDPATRRDAEHIITGLRFDTSRLNAADDGTPPAPAVPFTFDLPPGLAGGSYPAQLLDGYQVNLWYGHQKVLVNDEILKSSDAAASTFRQRRDKIVGSGATPKDVKTLPATASNLGTRVDEGFSVNINENGRPYLAGFLFRHGSQLVTLSTTVEQPRSEQTAQALKAPLELATSWTFTGE